MAEEFDNHSVSVEPKAYYKSLLHSLKYPTEDVIGLLIGRIDGKRYEIRDVQPLFHSRVLLPTLEIATEITISNLQKNDIIIGIYEARVNPAPPSDALTRMSPVAQEIIQSLNQKKINGIVLSIVQIEKDDEFILHTPVRQFILQIFSTDENQKFIIEEQSKLQWENVRDRILQGQHWKIVDFDAHFENVNLDFRNTFFDQIS